jgi:TolB-like protein
VHVRFIVVAAVSMSALSLLPASGRAAPRVALVPIVVHSSASEPHYLSNGLAEMLSARLEKSGEISVVRVESESGPTTRLGSVLELGRSAGADFVIYGSFTQFGQGASLDVRCAPLNGSESDPERRIFIQSGTVAEIIPQLDELAQKVARYVKKGDSPAPLPPDAEPPDAEPADEAPAAGAASVESYESLLRRVDALERAVYSEPLRQSSTEDSFDAADEGATAAVGAPSDDTPVR